MKTYTQTPDQPWYEFIKFIHDKCPCEGRLLNGYHFVMSELTDLDKITTRYQSFLKSVAKARPDKRDIYTPLAGMTYAECAVYVLLVCSYIDLSEIKVNINGFIADVKYDPDTSQIEQVDKLVSEFIEGVNTLHRATS